MRIAGMLAIALVAAATASPAWAGDIKLAREDPAHEPIRTLRREMVDAINKNDLDALVARLDRNIVVTWA